MKENSLKLSSMTRRSFLFSTAGGAAATLLPSWHVFAAPTHIDLFLKVSSILSGISLDKSYIQLGDRIWQSLTKGETEKGMAQWHLLLAEVDRLPEDASHEIIMEKLSPLGSDVMEKAKSIARVWYTGRRALLGGYEVIDYDDALVWRACSFTKPPVTCGGPFGYWHYPYEGGSQYDV